MRWLALVLLVACNKAAPVVAAEGGAGTCSSAAPCDSASASASATMSMSNAPPARLENTCAELRTGAKGTIGRLLKDESMYGTGVVFSREVYYGTVPKGSEIELLETTPTLEDKYSVLWIKVRVVCAGDPKRDDLQGRMGWLDLRHTSFADIYDPRTKKIAL